MTENLPASIPDTWKKFFQGLASGMIPSTVKAFDRLVGGLVDIPTAKLVQYRAKIDSQTESYKLVESAIARAAAQHVEADPAIVGRAVNALVRKEYIHQANKEAIFLNAVEDLQSHSGFSADKDQNNRDDIDDDWLNVFDRFAADASSERMRSLWGRVLAGEIRKPGSISLRTLRFLSEFDRDDATNFESISKFIFGRTLSTELAGRNTKEDLGPLLQLESAGLINGVTTVASLNLTLTLGQLGTATIEENQHVILLVGTPNQVVDIGVYHVTPVAQELLSLLPSRDVKDAARNVAELFRSKNISGAHFCERVGDRFKIIETFW